MDHLKRARLAAYFDKARMLNASLLAGEIDGAFFDEIHDRLDVEYRDVRTARNLQSAGKSQ